MGENIVVNVDFEGNDCQNDAIFNNSIQVVPADIAWEDFELMLKVYADQEDIHVYYTDTDSRRIQIKSQKHLSAAFTLAKQCNNTLHLRVQCGPPLEIKEHSPERDTVRADLRNQRVTMTTKRKTPGVLSDMVPIAMETGEHITQNEPGADWVVAKETGEKQCVSKPISHPVTNPLSARGKPSNKRFFFLKHKESGLVLEVKTSIQDSGSPLVLGAQKDNQAGNQLWYVDEASKTLRCKKSDLCLDASDKGAMAAEYAVGRTNQMWKVDGTKVCNLFNSDWVIGPRDGVDVSPGTSVLACSNKDSERLVWEVEYRKSETLLDLSKSARLLKATHARQNRGLEDVLEIDKELDKLGQHVQKLEIKVPPSDREVSHTGPCTGPQQSKKRDPPDWFLTYMKELKRDMVDQVSSEVANRTVSQVLRKLEGAVITSVQGGATRAPTTPAETPQSHMYHHYGIVCDQCEKTIVGVRYKCGNCEDYDLCAACESLGNTAPHPEDHVFLKIYRPVMSAGRTKDGSLVPLVRYNLYRHEERIVRDLERENHTKKEEKRQPRPQCKDHSEKMKKKQEKLRKKSEKTEEKLKKKEKRRLEEEKSHPEKKEKLERPDVLVPDHMDAEFLCDVTIPDGTHMQPLTTFVKTWRMKNTGTIPWTKGTRLVSIWGNMDAVREEVTVTDTRVGEEIAISAEIVAPKEPGTYQSHWRLSYCGLHFGHRIWCSIVVDPKEVLEEKGTRTGSELPDLEVVKVKEEGEQKGGDQQIQCYSKPGSGMDLESGEMLTRSEACVQEEESSEVKVTDCGPRNSEEGEQESFSQGEILVRRPDPEAPEIREVCTARASQTVTPNNTPQESREATRPHTPVSDPPQPCPEGGNPRILSTSSSVEVVSDDNLTEEAMAWNSDLVMQRMAQLELRPDIDLESLSSCGDTSDSDSDDDFFVVPIPDFFNPALPPSKAASTSVYIKKDEMQPCVVSEPLSDSQRLESQPLLSASHSFDYELLDTGHVSDQESEAIELLTLERFQEKEQTNHSEEHIEPMAEQETVEVKPELVTLELNEKMDKIEERSRSFSAEVKDVVRLKTPEVQGLSEDGTEENQGAIEVNQGSLSVKEEVKTRSEPEQSETSLTEVKHGSQASSEPAHGEKEASHDNTEAVASKLVATAIDVASKATNNVYKTAKDVFQTLKGNKEFVPPSSDWTPPEEKWTPAKEAWTPPPQEWTLPKQECPLPQPSWTPRPSGDDIPLPAPSTPMQRLIEMGFADRKLNEKLLAKHSNDLEKVILDLLSSNHNDWHSTRH